MITGANSGIGKCIAKEIAQRGGTIHLVCRNPTTANEAKLEIIKETENENIHVHILDLSCSSSVAKFARDFSENHDTLTVLINNAGCMINTRELNEDGFEKNFATNTLGTHLLTNGLMPLLKRSSNPRVVIVSSGGMLVQRLDKDDLQFEKLKPFDGTMAYAQNKRQQVVMTEQYSKMYPGVHFSSMHPGWADTPAVRSSMPDFYEKMKNKLRSPYQGADTALWLAISSAALNEESGRFFQDRKAVATHLPLAFTKVSPSDEEAFMNLLDEIAAKYK
ncbi:UNVERIFIED_CONTAM: hypothetical protein GTU68_002439 [Idotea baltica]|nr:hypothetical protein [Idotea baltica]MCL4114450.1 hypothetical protein [Idotea baltica]MCL4114451.1 hypothetical protein [Idotea baltica]